MQDDTAAMRARDFWFALILAGLSLFFIWQTMDIPFWGGNRAGVNSAQWYNSAALVPFGIFGAMFALSVGLLAVSIRSGGASLALSRAGIGWNGAEAMRFGALGVILFFFIAGLVPRVDFIISSGLLITALTFGFYKGMVARMVVSATAVALSGGYAMLRHLPQSEWRNHDDDIVALVVWGLLTGWTIWHARGDRVLKAAPIIALIAPTVLVCAMAFGFRQNVPNRGGLIFSKIEYHYYVTLRPMWRS